MKAVAAIVYFEHGTTTAEAKAILSDLKTKLDDPKTADPKYNGATIDHGIVNEYDDQYGSPVWYIP